MRVTGVFLPLAATAALAGCGGGGSGSSGSNPLPNVPPIAVAGLDQVVNEQDVVTLNGSASSDSDGSIASYAWSQSAGTAVTLASASAATTTFTAPALSVAETLTFELRITDSGNAAVTDVVNVTVNPLQGVNQSPQADSGPDRVARELGNVVLDGTASRDPDGSIASYRWQQIAGPSVGLTNANSARAFFVAPAAPASAEFELIVTDDEGAAGTSRVTITIVPAAPVTLSGAISFDLVPVGASFGGAFLDYGGTVVAPARGITVELLDAVDRATVLASGRTDSNGAYSLAAPNFAQVFVRVRAELVQSGAPGWNFRVVDNTNSGALYVIDGADFDTGATDLTRDLRAASGWNGVSYAQPRAAAPLAILDTIYDAVLLVLSADPAAEFPPLVLHWSPANRPVFGADGSPDASIGEIGTSFYRGGPGGGIFLLGAENDDTEEYDRHVIAHEWGHYLEDTFSRSDSIGGPHTRGDQLDMRVAFGEGWGNALSAMATGDSVYKDTLGPAQGAGFDLDIEQESRLNSGWYSEGSVQEILYDIYDSNADLQRGTAVQDFVNLGFGPIFDVLVSTQRTTTALTSLFPFVNAIKTNNPGAAAAIDALLGVHNIEPIIDDYGSTEDSAGNPSSPDVLPIYSDITVNGGAVNVCSTDDFSASQTGSVNKLGSRRYLRFQPSIAGTHTITVTTTSAPPGERTDPDIWLHRAGPIAFSDAAPTAACTPDAPEQCVETLSQSLQSGAEYVIEVYEWTNTNDSDSDDPPIGLACFDVEVTR